MPKDEADFRKTVTEALNTLFSAQTTYAQWDLLKGTPSKTDEAERLWIEYIKALEKYNQLYQELLR